MFEVEAGADEKQQIKFVWPYGERYNRLLLAHNYNCAFEFLSPLLLKLSYNKPYSFIQFVNFVHSVDEHCVCCI